MYFVIYIYPTMIRNLFHCKKLALLEIYKYVKIFWLKYDNKTYNFYVKKNFLVF